VTPPPRQRLSAQSSCNEQQLLSPPFSDNDNGSQFTLTPQSLYTPPEYPADFEMVDIPDLNVGYFDDDDEPGVGDQTMVEPQIDLMAVNDKLAVLKSNEPESEYANQSIGTEPVTYADVAIQASEEEPCEEEPIAPHFCVNCALAQHDVEAKDVVLEDCRRELADAEMTIQDLRLENGELREQVADREAIIGYLDHQHAADAEAHRVALEQRDEWVNDALEGQAVVHAELVDKVGVVEQWRGKYDAAMVTVSRLKGVLGGVFGQISTVADILVID